MGPTGTVAVNGLLADAFGRVATDLRISLTDRCNLRCTYCMPAEGLNWMPAPEILSDGEIVRLTSIAVGRLGVTEIRLTGGEPTLRPGLPGLVAQLAALRPRPEISLTTNGLSLRRLAPALAAAGLDRVNVSLDTLRRDRFLALTRRDRFNDVLLGLQAAADAGLTPVKVNSVLMRGVNDDEAPELLAFALEQGYELRFIEQMPLDPQHGWDRSSMVTAAQIRADIERSYRLDAEPGRGSAPAETYLVDGGPGKVGIIASVTAPFCAACDRVRLTADGQVRDCLFARSESDLRTPLRSGASDEELADRWIAAMRGKRAGHGIDDAAFLQPPRPMSAIGGMTLPAGRDVGFDAVVLAGGTSRRMGGGDKTALTVDGIALLDRTLTAVASAELLVVVGDERPTSRAVRWTREKPAGSGPAAAAAVGVGLVRAPLVVLLAGDLPLVSAQTVGRLLAAAGQRGALLTDPAGAPQWLLGAWPRALLCEALSGDQAGASLRAALSPLDPVLLGPRVGHSEWFDCDAPADVIRAQEMLRVRKERDE